MLVVVPCLYHTRNREQPRERRDGMQHATPVDCALVIEPNLRPAVPAPLSLPCKEVYCTDCTVLVSARKTRLFIRSDFPTAVIRSRSFVLFVCLFVIIGLACTVAFPSLVSAVPFQLLKSALALAWKRPLYEALTGMFFSIQSSTSRPRHLVATLIIRPPNIDAYQ